MSSLECSIVIRIICVSAISIWKWCHHSSVLFVWWKISATWSVLQGTMGEANKPGQRINCTGNDEVNG